MVSIPNVFTKYLELVDSIYEEGNIAKPTTLYFSTKEECPNCVPGSTSIYKQGGPIQFNIGVCPYCGGKNFIETTTTESTNLRIYADRSKWLKVGNLEVDSVDVQIIGKMSDFTKIKQCNYMICYTFSDWKFKLNSEPFPHGFGSRQFVAYCKRV